MSRIHFQHIVALLLGCALVAPGIAIAGQAPAFSLRTVDGKSVRLIDYRNRPVVLDFWATWCGPCRASMPHLNAAHDRYAKQGLEVIGLSVDEAAPGSVRRFANKLGVTFPIVIADDAVIDAYGPIRSIPTTFFINRRGEVVRRVVGYVDGETLDGYVQEILVP